MVARSGVPPSGTVAFLFTDIEGSTRLWEIEPQAMQSSLERHDEIIFGTFDRLGGYVFSSAGDGYGVSFASAADALQAATTIQSALDDIDWGAAPIRVRMGLHVGEAEERNGDYFGPAVNRAARIASAGHGGQTLATQAFVELVEPRDAVDLGEHHLRDLTAAQRLFQVGRGDFAPLRTIDAYPSNLPRSISAFVGRNDQLAQILSDVTRHPVVTLTGAGGVGKTRLAVQVCAEALPKFPGGAWFVDLASLRDADQIAPAVADVVGVRQRPGESLTTTLRSALRDRKAIVLLDNGEHLVDAVADLVAQLTTVSLETRLLLTSREPLGLDGEQVRRVLSLDVGSAVTLFVERAQAIRDDVTWADHADELVEICERLDGIPLAIELAAARSRSMLPADILGRLDERFRLLSGSRRSSRERHQTLLAAVEWSYELLDDDERELFARLAVFRGSFDLAAVEAVCSGGIVDELDVIDLVERLVDKSMVLSFGQHGRSRFRLLETMRQFGESKLVQFADAVSRREHHLDHYREVSRVEAARMASADQHDATRRLLAELDNLNAALDFLRDAGRWAELAQMSHSMLSLWSLVAPSDGRRWVTVLAGHAEHIPAGAERTNMLGEAAFVLSNTGDFGEARRVAQLGLEDAAAASVRPHFGSYYALAMVANVDGDTDSAIENARAALEDVGGRDPYRDLLTRSQLTMSLAERNDPHAVAAAEEFAAAVKPLAVPLLDSLAVANFASVRCHDSVSAAVDLLGEAMEIADGIVPHMTLMAAMYRAEMLVDIDLDRALVEARRATEVHLEYPVSGSIQAGAIYAAGYALLERGDIEDAAVFAGIAAEMLDALGVRGVHRTRRIGERFNKALDEALDEEKRARCAMQGAAMGQQDACRFIIDRIDAALSRR